MQSRHIAPGEARACCSKEEHDAADELVRIGTDRYWSNPWLRRPAALTAGGRLLGGGMRVAWRGMSTPPRCAADGAGATGGGRRAIMDMEATLPLPLQLFLRLLLPLHRSRHRQRQQQCGARDLASAASAAKLP